MKAGFMPRAMWTVFRTSFEKHLASLEVADGKAFMKKAKKKYQVILADIPQFGENDVLLINLLSAAAFAAIYLSLDKKPSLEQATQYYDASMSDSFVMRAFLKRSNYYSSKYQKNLVSKAELSRKSTNPYSWKFRFEAGQSLDSFDAIFDQCGICHLFSELGIKEIVPALCAYDYGMAKWTNTEFSRKYTLASGGEVCDCHYKKKINT